MRPWRGRRRGHHWSGVGLAGRGECSRAAAQRPPPLPAVTPPQATSDCRAVCLCTNPPATRPVSNMTSTVTVQEAGMKYVTRHFLEPTIGVEQAIL